MLIHTMEKINTYALLVSPMTHCRRYRSFGGSVSIGILVGAA